MKRPFKALYHPNNLYSNKILVPLLEILVFLNCGDTGWANMRLQFLVQQHQESDRFLISMRTQWINQATWRMNCHKPWFPYISRAEFTEQKTEKIFYSRIRDLQQILVGMAVFNYGSTPASPNIVIFSIYRLPLSYKRSFSECSELWYPWHKVLTTGSQSYILYVAFTLTNNRRDAATCSLPIFPQSCPAGSQQALGFLW